MGAQGSSCAREGATAVDAGAKDGPEAEGWSSMMYSYDSCCDDRKLPKPDTDIQFDAYEQNPRIKLSASARAFEATRVRGMSSEEKDVYQLRRDSFVRIQRGSALLAQQNTNSVGAPAQSVTTKAGMERWRSAPQLHHSEHHHHHHHHHHAGTSKHEHHSHRNPGPGHAASGSKLDRAVDIPIVDDYVVLGKQEKTLHLSSAQIQHQHDFDSHFKSLQERDIWRSKMQSDKF